MGCSVMSALGLSEQQLCFGGGRGKSMRSTKVSSRHPTPQPLRTSFAGIDSIPGLQGRSLTRQRLGPTHPPALGLAGAR